MLQLVSVKRRSETIINSTYCHLLCFIRLHTTFVKSYTFSAKSNHIRFRLLGSRLLFLIRRHILVVDLFHNGIRTFYSVQESTGFDI